MDMQPDISIVIPFYNGMKHIGNTVRSLSAIAHSREILIIDDGSEAESAAALSAMFADDPGISIITKENGGIVSARNAGLERSRGRYVLFVDQDDEVVPGVIDAALDRVTEAGADIAFWSTIMTYEADRPDRPCDTVLADRTIGREEIPDGLLKQILTQSASQYGLRFAHLWMGLYRRDFITENGISFRRFIAIDDDLIFIIDAVSYAQKICLMPEVGYRWLQNFDSESHTAEYTDDFLSKTIRHFDHYEETARRAGCSEETVSEILAFTAQATVSDSLINWADMPAGDAKKAEKAAIRKLLDSDKYKHVWDECRMSGDRVRIRTYMLLKLGLTEGAFVYHRSVCFARRLRHSLRMLWDRLH